MRTLLTALTCLILFTTPVVAGDWGDAIDAYDAGDYQEAFRLLEPLAEQGNAQAQYKLGLMYGSGEGVTQDYAKAVPWYRRAAEQGHLDAQLYLANKYQFGFGVPQSDLQAYAWSSIAAAQGEMTADVIKSSIEDKMTRDQIAKGQELAAEYWEKYVVPFKED